MSMLRLQTFGGLTLTDHAGAAVPLKRRRLALLALLAVAGERGMSRDKLAAYLWPESPGEHSRHALEQVLYSIRQRIPADALVGPDPLRINAGIVQSDVDEFERALARGAHDDAVALHRGPFLDGFFLDDASAFEQWSETERIRLTRGRDGALYRLAKQARDAGQRTLEIDWWRQLAAAEPLSERTALGLIQALAGTGDLAAALRHAEEYEALVGRELATTPTPELAELVASLRTRQPPDGAGRGSRGADARAAGERYRIERELGRGSMATVYLARDLKHDRDIALKVLRPELALSTEGTRFLREIAILAKLQHPHILPLFDSGMITLPGRSPNPYYVMPFVRGDSLRELLGAEGRLPLEGARRIAEQVASALSFAHGLGIVHRDVKPGNILLEPEHALLADFGIAHALDLAAGTRLSRSGVVVGTPGYMSPEQAAGRGSPDPRSDIYSLACVVYEMLAGEPPFFGRSPQVILARHAADPVPSLRTVCPEVPAEVETAILRALAKRPADRFPTVHEFALALGGRPAPP
jgi:DNA-binding SARP family transcriptional activator